MKDTAQQVDSGIAAWMECVTVNIMRELLRSRWTVVLQFECSVLQRTLCGRYCTTGGLWYCSLNGVCYSDHYVEGSAKQVDSGNGAWMECVTVNIMWKLLHSRWTMVLELEWSVCYREHYVEGIAQQVDSGIGAWMECVTVNIMWKVLHSRWTLILQLECSVLQWTLCGNYSTAGGQWYCSLNVVCYSEHYVEVIAQQVDSGIGAWMECVTVNIMWKVLHSKWSVLLQLECSVTVNIMW